MQVVGRMCIDRDWPPFAFKNKIDGFVKSSTSALGFISLSLGRTISTRPSGPVLADYLKPASIVIENGYIFYNFL